MTAIESSDERLWEAEVHRIAGELARASPEPDAAKAEAYFERALAVARQQQAKSWELRAAMSLARLWRDQGKASKRVNCWLRFTGGLRRGSTRATSRRRRRCWRNALKAALTLKTHEAQTNLTRPLSFAPSVVAACTWFERA